MQEQVKKPRGFATLTPERRREIASLGGFASQRSGRGHKFDTYEAKEAGRLSWKNRQPKGVV